MEKRLNVYKKELPIGKVVVMRKIEGCDVWVAHGDPIGVFERLGTGRVVDTYVVGARVMSSDVRVFYRVAQDHVVTLQITDQNDKSIFMQLTEKK